MNRTTSVLQLGFLLSAFNLLSVSPSLAQSIQDSIVADDNLTNVSENGIINGGAIRGTNIFHSFGKFNVPANLTADFQPNASIKTIFSRVTGTDPSIILGTLKVTGNANLFFINPRGIVFGSGAQLDTQGAFVATTANSIKFPDGTKFSTIDPQEAPLLTIETLTPIGLEFVGGSSGAIINAGNLLSKNQDSNISLIGGTVINTGTIYTINIPEFTFEGNGDISLVTVPSGFNSVVNVDNNGIFMPPITTSPATSTTIHSISLQALVEQAKLSSDLSTYIQPGDIFIGSSQPDDFDLLADLKNLHPSRLVIGDGGSLLLHSSKNINLTNTWIISVLNTNIDNNIDLVAKGDISFKNSRIEGNEGSVSNIDLTANNINLTADDSISTNFAEGKNGDIKLTATNQILLSDRAKISTNNIQAKSGEITLNADEILLNNGSTISSGTIFDGSTPGNINLVSSKIELKQNSLIVFEIPNVSESFNDMGNISLEVNDLSLDNESLISALANLKIKPTENNLNVIDNKTFLTNNSKLLTGRNIDIKTGTFNIDGGSIVVSRQGGDVIIDAKNSVTVSGFKNSDDSRLGTDNVSLPEKTKPGNLTITTNKLTLQDRGKISTESASNDVFVTPKSGNITIDANSIYLNQGEITANAVGKGNSGAIDIDAKDSIDLDNSKITSTIITNPDTPGNPGKIKIETPHLTLRNDSVISTKIEPGSIVDNPSNIEIKVTNLDLNNSEMTASTSGNGDAGDIKITARDRINLQNLSTISTSVESGAIGQGGKIDISSSNLDLNNSHITARTSGNGNAGNIEINESDRINLQNDSLISTSVNPGAIGQGGKIEVSANTLDIGSGSQVTTTTEAQKDAGDISLHISEKIVLDGDGSGLFANTGSGSTGNGGNIFIDPKVFIIQNQAGIFVNSQGTGIAGNIQVYASNLSLNNGKISAETLSNNGGDIALNITELLILQNRSKISTTAGKNETSGNGGNIKIQDNFLIANPFGDNDIIANAFTGNGGNINITGNGIFGFQIQDNFRFNLANNSLENNGLSEIVASSQFGSQGNIEINTLQIDPLAGLQTLPETTIDVQVSQGCQVRLNQPKKVEYFYLGRTGLVNNPEQLFSEEVTPAWTSWSNTNQNYELKTQSSLSESRLASSRSKTISGFLPCQQGN
jgi:filamentous hemagglutinin family protein